MQEKKYTIYQVDPESTIGLAIAQAIEKARKENKKVIIRLRNTSCVVTRHTKLSEGIERYRRTVEKSVRSRN